MPTAFKYTNNFSLDIYIKTHVQSKNIFYMNQTKKNSLWLYHYKFISVTDGFVTSDEKKRTKQKVIYLNPETFTLLPAKREFKKLNFIQKIFMVEI